MLSLFFQRIVSFTPTTTVMFTGLKLRFWFAPTPLGMSTITMVPEAVEFEPLEVELLICDDVLLGDVDVVKELVVDREVELVARGAPTVRKYAMAATTITRMTTATIIPAPMPTLFVGVFFLIVSNNDIFRRDSCPSGLPGFIALPSEESSLANSGAAVLSS